VSWFFCLVFGNFYEMVRKKLDVSQLRRCVDSRCLSLLNSGWRYCLPLSIVVRRHLSSPTVDQIESPQYLTCQQSELLVLESIIMILYDYCMLVDCYIIFVWGIHFLNKFVLHVNALIVLFTSYLICINYGTLFVGLYKKL